MIPWRDENPRRRFPVVSALLIAGNTLIFVWTRFLSGQFETLINQWGFVSSEWRGLDILETAASPSSASTLATPLTSLFLHAGVLHALSNLWFLKVFGDNVEDAQGRPRFLVFYILCGLFAVFVHYAVDPAASLPLVGASGAVSGVLAAYVFYYPTVMIQSFVPVIIILVPVRIPAFMFIGIWALIQVAGSMVYTGGPGIAYGAHVGGFLAGLALAPVFRRKRSSRRG